MKDAKVLFGSRRYDGAVYLCGYAVETALKARISKTLGWAGYPATRKEFENLQTFKTHSLEVLLTLSGKERRIKIHFFSEWSAVAAWDPEARYKPIGTVKAADAKLMIESARILVRAL